MASGDILGLQSEELSLMRNEMSSMTQELDELRNLLDLRDHEVLRLNAQLQELTKHPDGTSYLNDKIMSQYVAEIEHLRKCLHESVPKPEHTRLQQEQDRSSQKILRMQNLISRMQILIDQLIERIEVLVQSLGRSGRGEELMQVEIDMCHAQISRLQFCIDSMSKQQPSSAHLDNKTSTRNGEGHSAASKSVYHSSKLSIV